MDRKYEDMLIMRVRRMSDTEISDTMFYMLGYMKHSEDFWEGLKAAVNTLEKMKNISPPDVTDFAILTPTENAIINKYVGQRLDNDLDS